MSTPKEPRQITPEEVERLLQEPRLLPPEGNEIYFKTSTGLEGTIPIDDNETLKAVTDKISAAVRSVELNTGRAPAMFEMMIFLREIS